MPPGTDLAGVMLIETPDRVLWRAWDGVSVVVGVSDSMDDAGWMAEVALVISEAARLPESHGHA